MWRHLLPSLASSGRGALAPDLPGFGDSPPDPPGTWERHVETIERFRREVGFDRVVLVVHDTGGAVGLRWACDQPNAVAGLVITNTAFFPDWRGMLELYRSGRPRQARALPGEARGARGAHTDPLGKQDEYLPLDYASRFAREIPGSELVLLEGVRHFLFEDEPGRCAQEVVDFLRQANI